MCHSDGRNQQVFEICCNHRYSHQTAERQGHFSEVTQHLKGLIKETRPVWFYLSVIAWLTVWVWGEGDREAEGTRTWRAECGFSHHHFCSYFFKTDGKTKCLTICSSFFSQQVHFLAAEQQLKLIYPFCMKRSVYLCAVLWVFTIKALASGVGGTPDVIQCCIWFQCLRMHDNMQDSTYL